jgi:predicted small metal-binding protein
MGGIHPVTGFDSPPIGEFPPSQMGRACIGAGRRFDMPMKKRIACADVVPGCAFEAEAATEDELLRKVAEHAGHSHDVKQVSPELLTKVKGAIRDVKE